MATPEITLLRGMAVGATTLENGLEEKKKDFPGGVVDKTSHSQCRGPRVRSLVRELDPTCMPQLGVCMPLTKTPHNQINKYLKKKKEERERFGRFSSSLSTYASV